MGAIYFVFVVVFNDHHSTDLHQVLPGGLEASRLMHEQRK